VVLIREFIDLRNKWISEISFYRYKTLPYPHHRKVYKIEFVSLRRRTPRDYFNFINFIFRLNISLTLVFKYNIIILSCESCVINIKY